MAVYSNLTIDQGTDFSFAVDVTDTDGNALNLTGFTAAGQIRKSYSSSTSTSFTASIDDTPSTGKITRVIFVPSYTS